MQQKSYIDIKERCLLQLIFNRRFPSEILEYCITFITKAYARENFICRFKHASQVSMNCCLSVGSNKITLKYTVLILMNNQYQSNKWWYKSSLKTTTTTKYFQNYYQCYNKSYKINNWSLLRNLSTLNCTYEQHWLTI